MARHSKDKADLLQQQHRYALRNGKNLTPLEEKAEQKLRQLCEQDTCLRVTENFLTHNESYEKSGLVRFLQKMPKGAHLHVHNLAAGCFEKFSRHIVRAENLFLNKKGVLQFMDSAEATEEGLTKTTSMSPHEVYQHITMPRGAETLGKQRSWQHFMTLWGRVLPITLNAYFYDGKDSFFYELLKDQYLAGVRYLELRNGAGEVYGRGKETTTAKDYLLCVKGTVCLFQEEFPDFVGVKMILCGHKGESVEAITAQVRSALELHADPDVGDLVGGYDLVGEEDALHPLESYIEPLKLASEGGLPLVLHAGETNHSDRSCLYDAFLLGTYRIGHGYDIINHPVLLEKVVEAGTFIECCPISNDVLGYVRDMRNHSGKTMIRHGLNVTISADDPGMFHYHDVSYDWALAAKAWKLTLSQLKHLGMNSISGSLMTPDEKKSALEGFEKDWEEFLSFATA